MVSVEKISKSKAEWKKLFTPEQYKVTTEKGTEAPLPARLMRLKNGRF